MFFFFRRKKIKKYTSDASTYIAQHYKPLSQPRTVQYCIPDAFSMFSESSQSDAINTEENAENKSTDFRFSDRDTQIPKKEIQYSLPIKPSSFDPYDATEAVRLLRQYSNSSELPETLQLLERIINQTFVERLFYLISEKGLRDSEVYKAAQIDKRLFSKIASNLHYKPSKDTAVALALALELSLDQASDLLSRAGYTFSHSNKRDIILEFFFREKIYSLIDANQVLHDLGEKLIGRS